MKNPIPQRVQLFFREVKHSPFLKGHADKVNHFEDLPVLDRQHLKQLIEENFDLHAETEGVYLSRTGGTLNETLIIPTDYDEHLRQLKSVAEEFQNQRFIEPADIILNLMHYQNMYRAASQADDFIRFAKGTSIGLSAAVPDHFIYDYIQKFKPHSIASIPSRALQFANWVAENEKGVSIPKLLYGSEALSIHHYQAFRDHLQVKKIYTVFGSTETDVWGVGEYLDGGFLFKVHPDVVFMEIENPDKDGYGPAVFTNLCKKRFPILRYKTGDVGRIKEVDGIQYFEFKEKGEYTFRIHGTIFSERNFYRITSDAEFYQIQLDYDERKHTVLTICLVQQDLGMPKENFIREKEAILEDIIHLDSTILPKHVKLVNTSDLIAKKSTGKTPLVIDHRLDK